MNLNSNGLRFIIEQETGGEDEYNKHPEWPGEASGITIGIGYDLGYNEPNTVSREWSQHVDRIDLARLVAVSGLKGEAAHAKLPLIKDMTIQWSAALDVFKEVTVPKFYAQMLRIYPQAETLKPEQTAALLSLVFNRGASLSGERRAEMAGIKEALAKNELGRVPDLFRDMKRLWPDTRGLRLRRDREADLFATA
jgi:hypothetical protein